MLPRTQTIERSGMTNSLQITGAVLSETSLPRPYSESNPLKLRTLTLEAPEADEILVRVTAAGLCHSDLSVINNDRPRPLPMLLGHEATGIVESVGPDVNKFTPGDHVVLTFLPRCGECRPCKTDGQIPCENGARANADGVLMGGARRLKDETGSINHHLGVSGFADHVVVSEKSAVSIGKDVPADVAAIFGCAILTGGGAVLNEISPKPNDTLAVVGLGGVGMSAIIVASALGVKELIGIDMQPEKCKKAKELGASDAMSPQEAMERGLRFDAVVEAAGKGPALECAYSLTNAGGITVTVGLPAPNDTISINPLSITSEARRIHGSYLGSAVPERDIPIYESLWREGKLKAEGLVSSHIKLAEINEAMDKLADGEALRQIIMFDRG